MLTYVRQMLALPGIEVTVPDGSHPWLFKFDGGVGALMPRRGEASQHVKVFKAEERETAAAEA